MRIIAIDPGFGRLGVAVLEQKLKETLIFSECFETSPKTPFPERILDIGGKVAEIIKIFKPEEAALEKLFFSANQKTAMNVAEARGAILYELARSKIPIFEYTPLQIKTALTSYGRADKSQIELMVSKILSVDLKKKKDDEIDAIAVGITHFSSRKSLRRH